MHSVPFLESLAPHLRLDFLARQTAQNRQALKKKKKTKHITNIDIFFLILRPWRLRSTLERTCVHPCNGPGCTYENARNKETRVHTTLSAGTLTCIDDQAS